MECKKQLDILPTWMMQDHICIERRKVFLEKRPHSTRIRYAYLIYDLSININTIFINVNLEHL